MTAETIPLDQWMSTKMRKKFDAHANKIELLETDVNYLYDRVQQLQEQLDRLFKIKCIEHVS